MSTLATFKAQLDLDQSRVPLVVKDFDACDIAIDAEECEQYVARHTTTVG